MLYKDQFEIWQFTTGGIVRSIWNITVYYQWNTNVTLVSDNVWPVVFTGNLKEKKHEDQIEI